MAAQFDAVSSSAPSGTTNLSWSHVLGTLGGNGLVTVIAEVENSSNNISSATFNGVSMTQVVTNGISVARGCFIKMFELRGSDLSVAGTYTITVTFGAFDGSSNSRAAGAMSFGNIKNKTAEATASVTASSTNPLAQNITTLTKNALVIAGYANQNSFAPTFTTGETKKFDSIPSSGEQSIATGAYKTISVPALTSTSLTVTNPEDEVLILASYEVIGDYQGGMI